MGERAPDRDGDTDEPTEDALTLPGADGEPIAPIDPSAPRYEVVRALGAGAMGAVSLCRDRRLGREVAMKVMRAELATDAESRLRFEREARVQGQLEHAAIVPVHDIGQTGEGSPFFTMKRVQGESLRAVLNALRRGDADMGSKYGQRRLLTAFGTVCLAVSLAHSRGILHRDIKPSNIMFGDFGEVYLLDWGIAKVRRAGPMDETQEVALSLPPVVAVDSKVGDLLGTIGYMAPEQARGDAVDARADVYSLGAVLFEILTLERLHPREPAAALQSTLLGADARCSARAPGRRVPRELEELCVRATAIDPRERPAGARELHDVIERVLDGDRDLERRRKLSAEHAARARIEASRALAGAGDARDRAVQEAHAAIVLDPTNEEAVEILARLARNPAPETSRAADDALHAATMRMRRVLARTGVILFVPWLVGIALGACLGLRSPWALGLGTLVLASGAALASVRMRVDSAWFTFGALFCADLAAALTGAAFGPYVLVPGLLACTAVAFTVASAPLRGLPEREKGSRYIRHASMLLGVLAFLVPVALEQLGVLPPSLVIRDGALVLLPRAVDFPPGWTIAFLAGVNTILILVPAFIASRVRDHSLRAERDALSSIATMRQLLPAETTTVISAPPDDG